MSINTPDLGLEIPPLREGDRLTADEFHRRYEAMPELKNANLVNGVVHMSSPLRADYHGEPHSLVMGWLHDYRRFLPGIRLADNTTLRIDNENEPQPDGVLFLDVSRAGSAWIGDDGFLHGIPELIVEVAGSSARLDAGEKRDLYERIGVREYLLWRTLEDRIDWWHRSDEAETYDRLPINEQGIIKSLIFPGLWLHAPAMIQGNIRLLTGILEEGLASPEHLEFARRLNPDG